MTKAESYSKRFLQREVIEIQRSRRNDELPVLTVYEKAVVFKYSDDGYEALNEDFILKLHPSYNLNFSKSSYFLTLFLLNIS